MLRKLILIAGILSLAGLALADPVPPGPNSPFDNNPWSGNAALLPATGYLPNMDYHMDGVYASGSGINTIWSGFEWGSGYAGNATARPIGALMCTMGIAVFAPFGIHVDLNNRFYEIHSTANHGGGTTYTAHFTGEVGTNNPIMVGLRAPSGGFLQFPAGQYNPQVTQIRIWKGGSLVQTITNPSSASEALFQHNQCNTTFEFEVDVLVPQHINDGGSYLPFYFCPDSAL
jgi:hypothetical protein